MPLIKIYFSKIWPWLLTALIIALILLWPFKVLTEHYSKEPDSKIVVKNHLVSDKDIEIPATSTKNVLVFGGDIMLSRTVNSKMEKYQNYNWPLEHIASLFSEVDLAIANLESPFLFTNNYQVLIDSFSFKANPKSVSALTLAGFDVLSLANNHILNQGPKGLADTYKVLGDAGISYIGSREHNLVVKESNGTKFAFLSYTYEASQLITSISDESVATDILAAKKQSDVVIVVMHAGTEYTRKPNQTQIDFAHLAIDSGADLIVGTHPHWPQTMETYKDKTIIYSLGNLVFDQMWSYDTSVGLVAKVYFDGKVQSNIEYIPISIKDYGQATVMTDSVSREKLLKELGVK